MDDGKFDTFITDIKSGVYDTNDSAFKQLLKDCTTAQQLQASVLIKGRRAAAAPASAPRRVVPLLTNPGFDWLTYETLFNQTRFQKPNRAVEFGLYRVDLGRVNVFVRDNLPIEQRDHLRQAFLPGLDLGDLMRVAAAGCPWKGEAVSFGTSGKFAVLPYNHLDNTASSNALGTLADGMRVARISGPQSAQDATTTRIGLDLRQIDKKWQAWKTASRTCIVRTTPTQGANVLPSYSWNYSEGEVERQEARRYETSRYDLVRRQANDFSLKTGVQFVGRHDQSMANKDVLDAWFIGAMRSDYVADVDLAMKRRAQSAGVTVPGSLVILTEVLAITEKEYRMNRDATPSRLKDRDGVQVRDISALDPGKRYIPPTSIPFIDPQDMQACLPEFAVLEEDERRVRWADYWGQAWARALGRTKALFLLRYGLQHINPNVQNYLIEFEAPASPDVRQLTPTGRLIIRDLTDAALCREVAWALYGPDKEPVPVPETGNSHVADLARLAHPILRYEFSALADQCQETGTTDKQFGIPGAQTLWHRFSTFINGDKISGQREAYERFQWAKLLAIMVEWGRIHTRAYMDTVESELGVSFNIDCSASPDQSIVDIQEMSAKAVIEWEEQTVGVALNTFLRSADGQARLRQYRDRCWQPLPKTAGVTT